MIHICFYWSAALSPFAGWSKFKSFLWALWALHALAFLFQLSISALPSIHLSLFSKHCIVPLVPQVLCLCKDWQGQPFCLEYFHSLMAACPNRRRHQCSYKSSALLLNPPWVSNFMPAPLLGGVGMVRYPLPNYTSSISGNNNRRKQRTSLHSGLKVFYWL